MNRFDNDHGGFAAAVQRCAEMLDAKGRGATPQEILERIRQMQDALWQCPVESGSALGRLAAAVRMRFMGRQLDRADRLLGQVGRLAMPHYVPSGKPGLLYITHFDVFSRNGGAARVLGLGRALAARFDVRIISLVGPARSPEIVVAFPGCRVCFVPMTPAFTKEVERWRPRFGGAAESVALVKYHGLIPLLREWIGRFVEDAELCILNQPYMGGLWLSMENRPPLVYDTPEVNSFFVRRLAEGCPGVEEALSWQEEAERAVCQESVAITMVSESDCAEFIRLRGESLVRKILIVPNGIDVAGSFFAPPTVSAALRRDVGLTRDVALFIGAPRYQPNEKAIRFVTGELAPRLRDMLFAMVGVQSSDVPSLPAIPENMVFTGRLPERDKMAVMALSSYGLAPLEFDTGSSLKAVDYLASGKVVVATKFGLRGFDELAGHVRLAKLESFASTLEAVIASTRKDAQGVDASCAAARRAVTEHFDWEVIAGRLLEGVSGLGYRPPSDGAPKA